ncbi:OsmC family peroxiredoxin [Flavobacterium succinicans]|uniref:Peroxiredoxin OsmC n=1 Tax=Flavobacterium succinicans TaxID=29536 RepID=A0A199XTM7_9FLAO|nr:OsmC family peroxiredoxin [Flavobacterium succinicans]OAZ05000.1 peroxiredoxin OsmC [Flavobacterium succinicans]
MKIKRHSNAIWNGIGKDGKGSITSQSGVLNQTQYGFQSRIAEGIGTNPEELIASAHAGCFSMKLAFNLQAANFTPKELNTVCEIVFEDGVIIESNISLNAKVAGISNEKFDELVKDAKANCPISKLLNCKTSVTSQLN